MSLFIPTIPQANDNLDFSQGQLLSNNAGLDTVFGVDHYKFSNATASKGFHNQVTTPVFVASPIALPNAPPTTTTNPIFYGYEALDAGGMPIDNLGVLQYSRGPSDAVPTPLTELHSTAAAIVLASGATTNVLDFTGINLSISNIYIFNTTLSATPVTQTIYWNGSLLSGLGGTLLLTQQAGNILQIKNGSSGSLSIYWTLEFKRIQ